MRVSACASATRATASDELRGRLDEVGHVAPHPQPQRDPHGLAAGPSGVQPARVAPDRGGEPAFAAVVDLAVRGVVAELRQGVATASRSTPSNARAAASGMTPRSRRTSTCATSATFSPSCSNGASATSTANPPSTSSARVAAHWLTHPAGSASSACCRPQCGQELTGAAGVARPDRERHRPEIGDAEVGQAAQLLLDVRLGPDHRERTDRRHALALELPPVVVQAVVAGEAGLGGVAGRVRVVVHGDGQRGDQPGARSGRLQVRGHVADGAGPDQPRDDAVGELARDPHHPRRQAADQHRHRTATDHGEAAVHPVVLARERHVSPRSSGPSTERYSRMCAAGAA